MHASRASRSPAVNPGKTATFYVRKSFWMRGRGRGANRRRIGPWRSISVHLENDFLKHQAVYQGIGNARSWLLGRCRAQLITLILGNNDNEVNLSRRYCKYLVRTRAKITVFVGLLGILIAIRGLEVLPLILLTRNPKKLT
jgi:hypothetical protein